MHCPSCAQEIPDAARICPECGRDLVVDGAPAMAVEESPRRPSVSTGLRALLVLVWLIGAAVAGLLLAGRAQSPEGTFDPEVQPPAPSDVKSYLGCVGRTVEPNVFVLAVSQPKEADPVPAGEPVPREPTTPSGKPFAGGTPEQPPLAGTGEAPVAASTPVTQTETYVLLGTGGLEASDHVGHTVEVTGTLERPEGQLFPRLEASSVRHISDECGGA